MEASQIGVTKLLSESRQGNSEAMNRVVALLYDELRQLAGAYMEDESARHTLQPTALVNEAYLRLVKQRRCDWRDRRHFLALAATMMRRVLVDHARARRAGKRGGGGRKLPLDLDLIPGDRGELDLLDLEEALRELEDHDKRMSRIVELRFFAGMSVETIAAILDVTPRTVKRDWQAAKLLLLRHMRNDRPVESY